MYSSKIFTRALRSRGVSVPAPDDLMGEREPLRDSDWRRAEMSRFGELDAAR